MLPQQTFFDIEKNTIKKEMGKYKKGHQIDSQGICPAKNIKKKAAQTTI